MTCEECKKARIGPMWPRHCPTCIYCGARLIWKLQRKPIPREQKVARCRAVLSDWMAHGHSEAEIRRLAKMGAIPLAPELSA